MATIAKPNERLRERFLKLSGYNEEDIHSQNDTRRTFVTTNGGKYAMNQDGSKLRHLQGPTSPKRKSLVSAPTTLIARTDKQYQQELDRAERESGDPTAPTRQETQDRTGGTAEGSVQPSGDGTTESATEEK